MFSKYFWLSLLLIIVYFLYSYGFIEVIKSHLTDGKLNTADMIYFGLNGNSGEPKVFTMNELKQYTNLENGLYLSILGQVFDVTKGEKHYGPGENYHAFTGGTEWGQQKDSKGVKMTPSGILVLGYIAYYICRDASLAFITGEFDDQSLTDDISSLSVQQVKALNDWLQFYNANYVYKGKLYGRYYNRDGSQTAESYKVQEKLLIAKKEKALEEKQERMFPPCNVEWNLDTGTVFWCTKKSGGIDRDWVGVPRMLFETGAQGSSKCTCVKLDSKEYKENKARLREYDGCEKYATKCILKTNKI